MTGSAYVIRGGAPGRERLRVLSSVLTASTVAVLARVGVPHDARCLDLGCGGGDVTTVLARLAVDGSATGIDIDPAKIGLAREEATAAGIGNVDYRVGDITRLSEEPGSYDVVYARFLLSHLAEPEVVVRRMVELCKPGGAVIVEDTDISGSLCWPTCDAFERCCALYSASRPGDPSESGTRETRRVEIVISGRNLPGRMFRNACVPIHNVHIGVQVRRDPLDLIPADAASAEWRVDVRVETNEGVYDFKGPAVHGPRGGRFLYLTWGDVDRLGGFSMFRRAKLMLDQIDPELIRQAMVRQCQLRASVDLTDGYGGPRCGRLDSQALQWTT